MDYRNLMSAATKQQSVSSVVEDYLKTIYKLQSGGAQAVTTNALAVRLGVAASSASGMVRKLAEAGFAEHELYRGVRLTASGRQVALGVLRRHRLIELYLTEALGMPWDRVHEHAERLEHALSPELEDLIADKLGDPVRDPHGDPIPTRDGQLIEPPNCSLGELPVDVPAVLVRVSDSDPQMLRHLSAQGVGLGDAAEVVERQPFGGALVVRFADRTHSVGRELAEAMRVELRTPISTPVGAIQSTR